MKSVLRFDQGLGRLPYLGLGVLLFIIKIALDFALARTFGRSYSLLGYLRAEDSPLLRPAENPGYWLAMWAIALPFIAAGFVLTIRRLRDAGLSSWMALVFFVPFANILFFGFCALVPGGFTTFRVPPPLPGDEVLVARGRAAAAAGAAGACVGLLALGLAVPLLDSYGAALFIGAPTIAGFVSGILFSRLHKPTLGGAVNAAMLAILIAGTVVVLFAFEGIFCLVMSLPLVAGGALLGGVVGCLVTRSGRGPGSGNGPGRERGPGIAPTATALAALPIAFALESALPRRAPESLPVESSVTIDAPAETVWRHVVSFPPLPAPSEWIFQAGIAAPMEAVIEGQGVGAVRRCIFTTGSFVEPIEVWDPPHELRFSVASSPDPMRELTLWPGPRPPHLDGYLESTRGQFLLTPLPDGRTRLVGRTWYRTNMVPERYWRLWADPILHTIHMRVLRHIATQSEANR